MSEANEVILENVSIIMQVTCQNSHEFPVLELTLHFLTNFSAADIYIIEAGEAKSFAIDPVKFPRVYHTLVGAAGLINYCNKLVSQLSSKTIILYDIGGIVNPLELKKIVNEVNEGKIDFGYPFNGQVFAIPKLFKTVYAKVKDWKLFNFYQDSLQLLSANSVDGIVVIDRLFYLKTLPDVNYEASSVSNGLYIRLLNKNGRFLQTSSPQYKILT